MPATLSSVDFTSAELTAKSATFALSQIKSTAGTECRCSYAVANYDASSAGRPSLPLTSMLRNPPETITASRRGVHESQAFGWFRNAGSTTKTVGVVNTTTDIAILRSERTVAAKVAMQTASTRSSPRSTAVHAADHQLVKLPKAASAVAATSSLPVIIFARCHRTPTNIQTWHPLGKMNNLFKFVRMPL